ncbi:uncharacterized protein LOC141590359 [Silene latifolia]|uniref:uncharacterized protein LOC141590359 n=1 Tax=Silene latifolia TaxID=37657 RepID=UPI003D78901F
MGVGSHVEQQLQDIRSLLSNVPGLPSPMEVETPEFYADSPFVDSIALVSMPKGFTTPTMTLYDGTEDPLEHINQYKRKMMVVAAIGPEKEACICKGFGSTLSGATLQWFVNLPNKSISSFAGLVNVRPYNGSHDCCSSANIKNPKNTNNGPSENDTGKTKSVNEITGVASFNLENLEVDEIGEEWFIQGKKKATLEKIDEEPEGLLQFTTEDVQEELAYWKSSVYCFILGANPPWDIVEGFVRRIWANFPIDKVSFLPDGIFLVRFQNEASKQAVLKQGHYLFYNKPLIIRSWHENVKLTKDDVVTVSVWVKILNLPLKYWGKCLPKIAGLIRKYIRCDASTKEKTRLGFAKVLLEVPFGKKLPEFVKFLDEEGQIIKLSVESEWKLIVCQVCGGTGHESENCRKPKAKPKPTQPGPSTKQWVPKKPGPKPVSVVTQTAVHPQPVSHVTWNSDGKYQQVNTPARPGISLSRKEIINAGKQHSSNFRKYTFQDTLNNATPKVGIGTKVKNNMCDGWSVSRNTFCHPGGRVWVLWKPNVFSINFLHYSAQAIHMEVTEISIGSHFFCTMIYAFNDITDRKVLWKDLMFFADSINGLWMLCGDFNCVLSPTERLGGNTTIEEIAYFQACVDYCARMDCPAVGSFYTWNNKQDPSTRVYSRLDRVLVNHDWLQCRNSAYVNFRNEGLFDHSPCIIQDSMGNIVGRKSFKYFNMWSQVDEFLPCIQQYWDIIWQGTKMFKVVMKLKSLKKTLKELNKNLFGDVDNSSAHAWKALDTIQSQLKLSPTDPHLICQKRDATKIYRDLQLAYDSFLLQKSKATWVNQGDQNTKYFHSILKSRSTKSKVFKITDVNGNTFTDGDQIQDAFLRYYEHLLGTSTSTTPEHWNILLRRVTKYEVKNAIFSIPNHKAPGPDGFSSAFFKDSWSIVGDDVCSAVLDFFATGKLLQQVNHTFITLLPKCDIPQNVTQYRPIACCNVIYKAISKILCSRLADVLPAIVSPNQGGFVKGRTIVENILICQDIIRLYNRKSVSPRCLMKVDMKKAYDSVSWDFLEHMMHALKFPGHFTNLVMTCVRTASYSLVLNGVNFGYFHGAKGLRQGDPISPLLFTITMEYLTRILDHVTVTMKFKFYPLCGPLRLSHLLFDDDLLLFSKGDTQSIMVLLRAFDTFSAATGLQMNSLKSNIYFNGVQSSVKHDILQVSGFIEWTTPFKYLGVPIVAGRLSIQHCAVLIDRITNRIRSFGSRKLSYSGRLTLVNSVLTSLYTYWATIFVLPKDVLRRIDAICRNYLWDGSTEYIRAPKVSWEKVCTPKCEGGLGIRNSLYWNAAAICKLAWWVYTKPDTLWVRWSWKTICRIKEAFFVSFNTGHWLSHPTGYTVDGGYQWIRHKQPQVPWYKAVWNGWSVPKHTIVSWFIAREALQLKSRLFQLGISPDDLCLLCGTAPETHVHLFHQCQYTKLLLQKLSALLHIYLPEVQLLSWVQTKPWAKVKKKVTIAWIQALHYHIWLQRNQVRVDGFLSLPDRVLYDIRSVMKTLNAFRRVLHRDSDLYKYLTKHPCATFEEVKQMAEATYRLEEDEDRRDLYGTESSSRKITTERKNERAKPYSKNTVNEVSGETESTKAPPKLSEYGFTTGLAGVMKAIRELGQRARWPKKLIPRENDRRDASKRCEYHNDIRHNIEDCVVL